MTSEEKKAAAAARAAALEAEAVAVEKLLSEHAASPSQPVPKLQPSLARAAQAEDARNFLSRAGLERPTDFDGPGMLAAIERAFREADAKHEAATALLQADIDAVTDLRKAAYQLAVATSEVFRRNRTAGMAVTTML